jgi:hypothetical protein
MRSLEGDCSSLHIGGQGGFMAYGPCVPTVACKCFQSLVRLPVLLNLMDMFPLPVTFPAASYFLRWLP